MNRVSLRITGKNVLKFVKKISDLKLNLYSLNMCSKDEVIIIVDEFALEKLNKIKTIYKIEKLEIFGLKKTKEKLKANAFLIILVLINMILVIILSNHIFTIEVVENDLKTKELVLKSLNEYGIQKYKIKPNFNELTIIKNKILEKNNEYLEWIEIVPSGTKYIVACQKRIINSTKESERIANIVAVKPGIIKTIIAEKGQVNVEKEQYVRTGDVLIRGEIKLNDTIKTKINAKGKVYAETWYTVKTEQDIYVFEEIKNGKKVQGLKITFFNKDFKFFKELNQTINENRIISNSFLPIYLSSVIEEEVIKTDLILTREEAIVRAKDKARQKIESTLTDDEKIISEKQLKINAKDSKIIVEMFFTVYEEISELSRIEE